MEIQNTPGLVAAARNILDWQRTWQDREAWGNGTLRGSFRAQLQSDKLKFERVLAVYGGESPRVCVEMRYIQRFSPFNLVNMSHELLLRLNDFKDADFPYLINRHNLDLEIFQDPAELDRLKDMYAFIVGRIRTPPHRKMGY
jgi:hypothetical protein